MYNFFKKEEVFILKPNISKNFLGNMLKVLFVGLFLIIILVVIDKIIGLEVFLLPFEIYKVYIDYNRIIMNFALGIGGIIILVGGINYLLLRGVRYEFKKDELFIYRVAFLFLIYSKKIPYTNILRISYDKEGMFNRTFNSGKILFELTGMNIKKVELEFIDNPRKVISQIQKVIKSSKQLDQAKFSQKHKIETLLDEL